MQKITPLSNEQVLELETLIDNTTELFIDLYSNIFNSGYTYYPDLRLYRYKGMFHDNLEELFLYYLYHTLKLKNPLI